MTSMYPNRSFPELRRLQTKDGQRPVFPVSQINIALDVTVQTPGLVTDFQ